MGQPNPKGDDTQVVNELTGHASKVTGRSDCKPIPWHVVFSTFECCSRIRTGSVSCSCAAFLSVTCVTHVYFATFGSRNKLFRHHQHLHTNSVDDRSGQPDDETQANRNPKTKKKETTIERGNPFDSEIPEWLQEFRENLVDDQIPLQGGSHASSSHEASLEPTTKRREDLSKLNVHTHFPKDRNCEICKRTKITRAPCRRRKSEAVPRADNFGDLITADHKVPSDNCESRNNHRYAVVVQDLATQWIQAYLCKNKTSQETERSLQKFLEPERKPKVIYTDNSLEFGKACEDVSWNHCTSTPHRSETNGIAERAVRKVRGRHLCCIAVIRSK